MWSIFPNKNVGLFKQNEGFQKQNFLCFSSKLASLSPTQASQTARGWFSKQKLMTEKTKLPKWKSKMTKKTATAKGVLRINAHEKGRGT